MPLTRPDSLPEDSPDLPDHNQPWPRLNLGQARQRLRQRLNLLNRRTRRSVSHTRWRMVEAGRHLPVIGPARPRTVVRQDFNQFTPVDNLSPADHNFEPVEPTSAATEAGPEQTGEFINPVIADPEFQDNYVIQSPVRTAPPPAFDLPQDLADLGLAVRLQAVRPRRMFTVPTTGRQVDAAGPAGFEREQTGLYISMFDGVSDETSPPDSPQTVADRVRRLRPYGANTLTGPVAYNPVGAEDQTTDQEADYRDETNPAAGLVRPGYRWRQSPGRSRANPLRRIFHFRNPAAALIVGLVAAILLALLVFGLVFLSGWLDKAPVEKYAVVFAHFGEGRGYNSFEPGQGWARNLGAGLAAPGAPANTEIRYHGGVIRDSADALRTGERTGADATVWGYLDRPANKLYAQLTLTPNGPFDQPDGGGRKLLERQLFDPENLVFVAAPPTGSDQAHPLNQLLRALAAYYEGAYDTAVAEFSRLLNRNEPENEPGLRLLRGNALIAFGKYAEAVEDYNQLNNINQAALARSLALPVNPAFVHNNRGVALTYLRNYPEANKAFTAALAVRNDLPRVFANYANLLMSIPDGDFEFQPALLEDWKGRLSGALKLDPRLTPAQLYLGRIERYLGNYEGALAAQNRVRELDIDYLESYYELGLAYLGQGRRDARPEPLRSALDAFKWGESRALAQAEQLRLRRQSLSQTGNPTLAGVYDSRAREAQAEADRMRLGLARTYLELTRLSGKDLGNPLDRLSRWLKGDKTAYEEAGPRLKELAEKRPDDPEINFYYGQFLALTGEGDPASYYRKAKELEQNSNRRFRYYQLLAEQHRQAGRPEKALAEYNEFIKLEPRRLQGYLALAELQIRLGQYKEAVQTAEAAGRVAPNDPRPPLAAGTALVKSVQLEAALGYLDRALKLNPDLGEAHLQRGLALFHLNRRPEALEAFNQAIRLNAGADTAHYYAGIVYLETLKDTRNAQTAWEKAVAANPRQALAWVKLGQLYSQLNQLDQAARAYEQALAADERDATAHYYLGLLYEGRRQPESLAAAERHYRRAIELAPGLVNAYYRLANVLRQTGKADDALALAQNAARLEPQNPEAQAALGDVRRARGEYDAALDAYGAALKLRGDYPEALYGRAAARQAKQDYNAALADINRALQLRPTWVEAYLLQGQLYGATNQPGLAQNSLEQARQLEPDNPRVLAETGNLQEMRGEFDRAVLSYEKAISLYEPEAETHFRLGRLYFLKANYDGAVKRLKRAQELNGRYPKVYYWLGRSLAALKRYDEALPALEKAAQFEPDFIEGRYELGAVYRARGQRDLALDQFEAALRLQPGYGPAWLAKAQIYEELVDLPRAREAYEQAIKSNDTAVREAATSALRRLGVKI